jgi:pimeloyl-ACP methyl ester carboxylesterase
LKQSIQPESTNGMTPDGTCFAVYGKPTNRLPLVFIHGVGLNNLVWQSQVEEFSKQRQCIVYDILGHGKSQLPTNHPCLDDYSEQLSKLINFLDIRKVNLVGHSMGALIGINYSLEYPNCVESLIALNTVYQRTEQQSDDVLNRAMQVQSNAINADNESADDSDLELVLQRWFSKNTDPDSIKKIEKIRHWMTEVSSLGYARTYQLFATADKVFSGKLARLSIPVLYMTGSFDRNSTPLMSKQMAAETPKGKAWIVEEEAHMMTYISPEKINPIINSFLKGLISGNE